MGKQPAFQFYPGDWIQDTRILSLAARGAWIDLLCAMWRAQNRGELSLTWLGYSRLLAATVEQTKAVIAELVNSGICDSDGQDAEIITLRNRRMAREARAQSASARRQAEFRAKGGGNPDRWTAIRVPILIRDEYACAYCGRKADTVDHIVPKSKGGNEDPSNLVACCKRCNMTKNNRTPEEAGMSFWKGFQIDKLYNTNNNTEVTPPSSSSSSSSKEIPPISPPLGDMPPDGGGQTEKYSADFLRFWDAYPRKVAKGRAWKAWKEARKKKLLPAIDAIVESVRQHVKTEKWQEKGGEFIPYPATWLNSRQWEDELPGQAKPRDPSRPNTDALCRIVDGQVCQCGRNKPIGEAFCPTCARTLRRPDGRENRLESIYSAALREIQEASRGQPPPPAGIPTDVKAKLLALGSGRNSV